jgi:hypothetical protein
MPVVLQRGSHPKGANVTATPEHGTSRHGNGMRRLDIAKV